VGAKKRAGKKQKQQVREDVPFPSVGQVSTTTEKRDPINRNHKKNWKAKAKGSTKKKESPGREEKRRHGTAT